MPDSKSRALIPEIVPSASSLPDFPDELKLGLGLKARKALDYLIGRLTPYGYAASGGREFLDRILTPLIKCTHSKKSSWREKIVASRILAEMVGIYLAGEQSHMLSTFRAVPRRRVDGA